MITESFTGKWIFVKFAVCETLPWWQRVVSRIAMGPRSRQIRLKKAKVILLIIRNIHYFFPTKYNDRKINGLALRSRQKSIWWQLREFSYWNRSHAVTDGIVISVIKPCIFHRPWKRVTWKPGPCRQLKYCCQTLACGKSIIGITNDCLCCPANHNRRWSPVHASYSTKKPHDNENPQICAGTNS